MGKLSVETEFDKAVDAAATSLADCNYRKVWGTCNEAECAQCDIKKYQDNCLNGFADMDKLRVYNKLQILVALQDVPDTKEYATGKEATAIKANYYLKEIGSMVATAAAIIFIPLILLLGIITVPSSCMTKLAAQSIKDYDYTRYALPGEAGYAGKYRKQILDTLDRTKQYVTDVNKDGEINCIDYSCTFKMLWDKMYDASNCEIVRNKSSTMNHLFIRTRQYSARPWECIEPQAGLKNITKYFMEDFWSSDIYNPMYNIYGETDRWLQEVSSD